MKEYYNFHWNLKDSGGYDSKLEDYFNESVDTLSEIYSENLLHIKGKYYDCKGNHRIYVEKNNGIPTSKIRTEIMSASSCQKAVWVLGIIDGLITLADIGIDFKLTKESVLFVKDSKGYVRPKLIYYWEPWLKRDLGKVHKENEFCEINGINTYDDFFEQDILSEYEYQYYDIYEQWYDEEKKTIFEHNLLFLESFFESDEKIFEILKVNVESLYDLEGSIVKYISDTFKIRLKFTDEVKKKTFNRPNNTRKRFSITDEESLEEYVSLIDESFICKSKVELWDKGSHHYTLYCKGCSEVQVYGEKRNYYTRVKLNSCLKEDEKGSYLEVYKLAFISNKDPEGWYDNTYGKYISPFRLTMRDYKDNCMDIFEGEIRAHERNRSIEYIKNVNAQRLLEIWKSAAFLIERQFYLSDYNEESPKYIMQKTSVRRRMENLKNLKDYVEGLLNCESVSYGVEEGHEKKEKKQTENRDLLIEKILDTEDIFVLQGPPGTGKTSLIKRLVERIRENDPKAKLLISTQDNDALSHIYEVIKASGSSEDCYIINRTGDIIEGYNEEIIKVKKEVEQRIEYWKKLRNTTKKKFNKYIELLQCKKQYDTDIKSIVEINDKILRSKNEGNNNESYIRKLCTIREQYLNDALIWKKKIDESTGKEFDEKDFNEKLLKLKKESACVEILSEWLEAINSTDDLWFKEIAMKHHVVAVTCNKLGDYIYYPEFDWVIVDEAAKVHPLDLLIPMNLGKKVLLVGDQDQLPPNLEQGFVEQQENLIEDVPFESIDGKFKTLEDSDLKKLPFPYLYNNLPKSKKGFLSEQYRMCPVIGGLVSNAFYDGRVVNGERSERKVIPEFYDGKPLLWLSTSRLKNHLEECKVGSTSYYNTSEVDIICESIKKIRKSDVGKNMSIIVITGYSSQLKEIKNRLRDMKEKSIKVGTVDAFQGQEADIVFMSMVRSNNERKLGFLKEKTRMNVAFSRARDLLVVVGDSDFFFKNNKTPYAINIKKYFDKNEDAQIKYIRG